MFVDDISGLLRAISIETLIAVAGPELDSLVRWYVCTSLPYTLTRVIVCSSPHHILKYRLTLY